MSKLTLLILEFGINFQLYFLIIIIFLQVPDKGLHNVDADLFTVYSACICTYIYIISLAFIVIEVYLLPVAALLHF